MSHTADVFREDVAARPAARGRSRKKLLRWVLMAGGVLAVAVGGGFYWLSSGRWVETDDAYVQADSMTLSTDVSGVVASIPVHEGQAVTKGETLFTLDPQKFQIALDNARANLAQIRLNIEAAKADYQAALRDTAAKQQQVNSDQATYDRYASLVKAACRHGAGDRRRPLQAGSGSAGDAGIGKPGPSAVGEAGWQSGDRGRGHAVVQAGAGAGGGG